MSDDDSDAKIRMKEEELSKEYFGKFGPFLVLEDLKLNPANFPNKKLEWKAMNEAAMDAKTIDCNIAIEESIERHKKYLAELDMQYLENQRNCNHNELEIANGQEDYDPCFRCKECHMEFNNCYSTLKIKRSVDHPNLWVIMANGREIKNGE